MIDELLASVRRKGVKVELGSDGGIKLRGNPFEVKAAKELLRPHKDAIIARLTENRDAVAATVTISPEVGGSSPVPRFLIDRFVNALAEVETVMRKAMDDPSSKYFENDTWPSRTAFEHIQHSYSHLARWLCGDTTEDHLTHAACRALIALQNRIANPDANPQPKPDPAVKPQPAVGEVIEALRQTLCMAGGYSWTDEQVDRLHERIRPIDRIVRVDPGPTVIVQRPDGAYYQLRRYDA